MMNVKISVVTICYNAESIIEDTIKSVVNQTYPNIEYIVIDGGSTDGTVEIVKKYDSRISYWLSEPDGGIYDAMNKGIKAATGKWINFMNAGDSFHSANSISEAVKMLNEDSIVAYGNTLLLYSFGPKLKIPDSLEKIKQKMVFGHQATFVRTSYHKAHLFDTTFRSSGDYKFFYDTYSMGAKFQYIPVTIANYLTEGGISSSNSGLVKKEDARIRGIDHTIQWKIAYLFDRINVRTREFIKRILPHSFVEYIRYQNFKKL